MAFLLFLSNARRFYALRLNPMRCVESYNEKSK